MEKIHGLLKRIGEVVFGVVFGMEMKRGFQYHYLVIITPIKTRTLVPPQDDLISVIRKSVRRIPEKSIMVITSKVVSIWQGRCLKKEDYPEKDKLIISEAEKYLPRDLIPNKWVMHTINNHLILPTAGIDESNAGGYYILLPEFPRRAAEKLWRKLREIYRVKNLGIIISDSHSLPLRRGTVGVSLAHYGFQPLKDYRGRHDLFHREFKITQSNLADSLAASAVAVMGEGSEQTPLALISDIPFVKFGREVRSRKLHSSFYVPEKEDIYHSLFAKLPWRKGGGGIEPGH